MGDRTARAPSSCHVATPNGYLTQRLWPTPGVGENDRPARFGGMAIPITDDRPLRWGFIGAGGIAEKFAQDLDSSPSNLLAAVAARSKDRAQAFAERHDGRGYGDYRAVVEDPDVDVVYVATTH